MATSEHTTVQVTGWRGCWQRITARTSPWLAAVRRRVGSLGLLSADSPPLGALRERHPAAWLLPLAALAVAYAAVNFGLPLVRLPAGLSFYVVQPALWLLPGLLALLLVRRAELFRLPLNTTLIVTGLFIAAVQIAAQVILGVLAAFGRSPYSHALGPMLANTLRFLLILVSVETFRGYLSTELSKRSKPLALALPAVVLALAMLPVSQVDALAAGLRPAVTFAGETLLPALAESLLATFLALLGGPLASIAYRGLLLAFHWWAPVLPNPSWIMTAFVGTLVPLIGLIGAYDLSLPPGLREETAPRARRDGGVQWLVVAAVLLVLVWFNNGALGYHPTLLSGPSMRPGLWAGDVVIVKKVPADSIQVGDIIKYQQLERHVVHRVVEINREGKSIIFITQGDNVDSPDPPVMQEQLVGKVVLVLPKVGYLSIWLRRLLALLPV